MPFCRRKMLNFGPKTESQGGSTFERNSKPAYGVE